MNCNPLTLGHLYLINSAARQVEHLYIIPVMEGDSEYSYSERMRMLEGATAEIGNLTVCRGSGYVISRATFPSYFLKEQSDVTPTYIELDLDIFARKIAPALGASVRFVGSEPIDALTRSYNEAMHSFLPSRGIEVIEIERMEKDGLPVSASRVRQLVREGKAGEALRLVPKVSIPFLLAHAATDALLSELMLSPKPGLVDALDSGSHTDMNLSIMQRGIEALTPHFAALASLATGGSFPSHEALKKAGLEAEKSMLEATGGVNTHRGALFSLGLTIVAAAHLVSNPKTDNLDLRSELPTLIERLAAGFNGNQDSNGAKARNNYGLPGAADMAKEGYRQLYSCWLPYYRNLNSPRQERQLRLLLRIMIDLEDTNIYHRGGPEGAQFVKMEAQRVLSDFSEEAMKRMNEEFKRRNLSPGGAADMLALTLLTDSLTAINNQ